MADVCTEPFGENNFIAGIIIGTICASIVCCVPHIVSCCICKCLCKSKTKRKALNTTTVPNQITTVDNVETNTSAGVINEYSETVHQESTQVQVMADATNDHTYRNVAPSVALMHRKTNSTGIITMHVICIIMMVQLYR